jgi:tRNA threonylcarbamoyladenosine biosynthesis protein TsaE
MSGSPRPPDDDPRESDSPEETRRLAAALAPALRVGDLVSLSGPLGAGKTCFVAGLAEGIGASTRVRSPSFTLVNEYPGRLLLFHLDLYRLDGAETDDLGIAERRERGALVVEWGEKLPARLRGEALSLGFAIRSERVRLVRAEASGARGAELLAAWRALGARTRTGR